ncbi:hypothetical protein [Gloeobacter kilaueensis]|uniref:PEP-CTERM protein-sorting domain-containing protein n=1 Tax=Gloeobacter kilaueensis (strain ATCC BAA-2537 / CCAP 1431/1 / ULC 316 / JS1) TaxID=1183438 RepID=U5QM09_GLOK1|nr:hypothetical protein [Gloeobacter kilaueensis]AGY59946.1 hypothetical protein GKIL_3700 [Gloeobacter kilaueensis JS1]
MRCGPIRQLLASSLALPGLLGFLSLPAYAFTMETQGVSFISEDGDAGQLLNTAYRYGNPQIEGSPIGAIFGSLSLKSDGTPSDLVDLYQIEINNGTFSADTSIGPSAGNSNFRPALYLFDAQGNGLLANADISAGPTLEASGLAPGIYYVAASYAPLPLDDTLKTIFPVLPGAGQVGPNSGAGPLSGWSSVEIPDAPNQTLSYTINLGGAEAVPEPSISGGMAICALLLAFQGYRQQKARS